MSDTPFELKIVSHQGGEYGIELSQTFVQSRRPGVVNGRPVVRAWGLPLQAVIDYVLQLVKGCGYRATDLSPSRQAPLHLDEPAGVRLGLLLLAVKPLRKLSRIEAIASGVRAMSDEETYYWFSKCTTSSTARRAQRALRILLAEE